MRTLRPLAVVIGFILIAGVFGFGATLYVAQTAQGTQDGSSCANAKAWNTAINASDVFHLCGTISGSGPGTSAFTPPSGSPGSPTTIIFETGAKLSQTYWSVNGAIKVADNIHDVLIDGSPTATACGHVSLFSNVSCNGIIQNTANGTPASQQSCDPSWPGYPNQKQSSGIYLGNNNSNIEIRNLHIQNIYRNDGGFGCSNDSAGFFTWGIYGYSTCVNCNIHHNEVNTTSIGIASDIHSASSGLNIHHNYVHDSHWQINTGIEGSNLGTQVALYHDNELTDWLNWQCPATANFCNNNSNDAYHTDGFILIGTGAVGSLFKPYVYNNYMHGSLGHGSATAQLFPTYDGNTATKQVIHAVVFNNIFDTPWGSSIWLGGSNYQTEVYNNTFVTTLNSEPDCIVFSADNIGINWENNVCHGYWFALNNYGAAWNTVLNVSDYNDYSAIAGGPSNCVFCGPQNYTFALWRSAFPSRDANSSTNAANLSASYQPNTGSWLIGHGTNLSGVTSGWPSDAVTAFGKDIVGTTRGTTWDIGAVEYSTVPAPTQLTPTVH